MTRRPEPLPHLGAVAAALAATGQPQASFAALERALGDNIGHRLFTIMRHDAAGGFNARIHSSRPGDYPVAGRKPVADTPWSRRVVREGLPWICHTPEDIRQTFPDHALILSLGLRSALNLPVRFAGSTLGALNLLHDAEDWYDEADAALGQVFAGLAAPALLAVD